MLSALAPIPARWRRSGKHSTTWTFDAPRRSTTWTRRATAVVAGSLSALVVGPGLATAATAAPVDRGPVSQYVVRAHPGGLTSLHADLSAQGTVVRRLPLLQADVVRLHAADAAGLTRDPRVAAVSTDSAVHLFSEADDDSQKGRATETLAEVAQAIGSDALRAEGTTGRGVDVALIDSGIAPVAGLTGDKVVHGPDLSFDSQFEDLRRTDGYGHGTHLAGIIAGNNGNFTGVAPGARLLSVKVADRYGNADVSQVIAGIAWVIQHRQSDGLNVRVLNLAFGTDSEQAYDLDPLAYAAEQAWHAGIVVVVSAGNGGKGSRRLTNPAIDPYVLAVGAADTTRDETRVATFSSSGDGRRNPDLVAPGTSIASLRSPGSAIDERFGHKARTTDGLIRGSGTSQAAAVTAGAAALLLQTRPQLTPDQVKTLLTGSANRVDGATKQRQGHGLLDVRAAAAAPTPHAVQDFDRSTGRGSLEAARGTYHLGTGNDVLEGEQDIFGNPVDTTELARLIAAGQSWVGGVFNGQSWAGDSFAGQSWGSQTWAAVAWGGQSWASQTWAGQSWASQTWAGQTWG